MSKNKSTKMQITDFPYSKYKGKELPPANVFHESQPQPMPNDSGSSHGSKSVIKKDIKKDCFGSFIEDLNKQMMEPCPIPSECLAFNRETCISQRKIK